MAGKTSRPTTRSSRWTTKPKIAAASALLGLIFGAALADSGSHEDELQQSNDRASKQAKTLAAKLDEAKDDADAQASAQDEAVTAAVDEQKALVKRQVARAVLQERRHQVKLRSQAVAKAKKAATTQSRALAGNDGGIDPRFGTCGEANAAGYGNYRRGADPEYDWYMDRDGDGFVCE